MCLVDMTWLSYSLKSAWHPPLSIQQITENQHHPLSVQGPCKCRMASCLAGAGPACIFRQVTSDPLASVLTVHSLGEVIHLNPD